MDPERSITRPVLESYALPELSIILVLGVAVAVLRFTEELLSDIPLRVVAVLPDTPLRVVADLPDKALRVLEAVDDLPERRAAELLLLAELER